MRMLKNTIILFLVLSPSILCLPVTKTSTAKPTPDPNSPDFAQQLEYERYLKEVVSALESDPEFRKKLDQATDEDIRSGNIANELEYVSHHVRSKLDEIKREEIERLRQLAKHHYQLSNGIDENHLKISQLDHVDHGNAHTFEIEDLRKLIKKTSEDLNKADKARREEFKQYELQKEFEKQEKLRSFKEEQERKRYESELEKQRQKHNNHEKIHHPGNKAQLEEVWEKQDHMEGVDFDPKSFFMMHDLDSNGFWDQEEVKALFIRELNKMYEAGAAEDDLRERAEEMERMREHVFNEADRNRDGLIDYQEFIDQTKSDQFQKDANWDTVDNEKQFTHEEYLEFERRRQEEMRRIMAEHPDRYPEYRQQQILQQQQNQQLDQQHHNQQQQYQQQFHQPPQQYNQNQQIVNQADQPIADKSNSKPANLNSNQDNSLEPKSKHSVEIKQTEHAQQKL